MKNKCDDILTEGIDAATTFAHKKMRKIMLDLLEKKEFYNNPASAFMGVMVVSAFMAGRLIATIHPEGKERDELIKIAFLNINEGITSFSDEMEEAAIELREFPGWELND